MTKPSKTAQYRAEADRLRGAVDAYRAERGLKPSPAPTKPERRRLSPAASPTEIPGYPLNPTPPAEIPDYGNMARVTAIKTRQRKVGAQLPSKPVGEPQLIKRGDLRTGRTAE
jgi:hypothetical protein